MAEGAASSHEEITLMTDKQKEILKKIRALPLRKYGSAKHKKLIKEYIKHDPYFPPSKTL